MKRIKSFVIASLLCGITLGALAQSDTNTPPPKPDIGDQVKGLAATVYDQVTDLDLKGGFTVEPLAIYHAGDWGGGISVMTAKTNGLNFGVSLVAIDESNGKGGKEWQFYDASLSIAYRLPVKVPIINQTLDAAIATGPAFNARDPNTVYEQSTATASKTWDAGNGFRLKLGGGIGHCSRWSDPFYVGFVGVTKTW